MCMGYSATPISARMVVHTRSSSSMIRKSALSNISLPATGHSSIDNSCIATYLSPMAGTHSGYRTAVSPGMSLPCCYLTGSFTLRELLCTIVLESYDLTWLSSHRVDESSAPTISRVAGVAPSVSATPQSSSVGTSLSSLSSGAVSSTDFQQSSAFVPSYTSKPALKNSMTHLQSHMSSSSSELQTRTVTISSASSVPKAVTSLLTKPHHSANLAYLAALAAIPVCLLIMAVAFA